MKLTRLTSGVIPQAKPRSIRPVVTPHAIVEAVAERNGVPATRLQPPLYDAIDPDALLALLKGESTQSHAPIEVRFEYAGCLVTVGSDGTLEVE